MSVQTTLFGQRVDWDFFVNARKNEEGYYAMIETLEKIDPSGDMHSFLSKAQEYWRRSK